MRDDGPVRQEPERPSVGQRHAGRRVLLIAVLVFAALFGIYQANLSWVVEGDTAAAEGLPVALLLDGGFSFDPVRFPEMFRWRGRAPFTETAEIDVETWDDVFGDRAAREWLASGHLRVGSPRYFLARSPRRGVYVSVFGPIPGLLLTPLLAPFYHRDPSLLLSPDLRAMVAKGLASALVALTASLLFLIAARRSTLGRALVLAAVYGLGSCAWSVSSQNLWQQTVNQALLAAGACFALDDRRRLATSLASGFFFGAAVACRVTAVFPFALVIVSLGLRDARRAVAFGLGALPVLLLIAGYNVYYFGSPFTFAQELVGRAIALQKTGSPALFQTPFLVGAAGLLFSPSRGLAVYSPVLLAAAPGLYRSLREPRFHELRPFGTAAVLMMAVQCKWFDWWGGHTYGYRPWLDAVPYLTLLLLPVLDAAGSIVARGALTVALFWSVFVQGIGASGYDRSWNDRQLFIVEAPGDAHAVATYSGAQARRFAAERSGRVVGHIACDVDLPACRYRLWSIDDNPIAYYLLHHAETSARRRRARWPVATGAAP